MPGQILILLAALLCGFLLRLALRGITLLHKKRPRWRHRSRVKSAGNAEDTAQSTVKGIGLPAVVALDTVCAFLFSATVLVLTLVLNDGILVPFTTMFFFLGLSLPSLFLK